MSSTRRLLRLDLYQISLGTYMSPLLHASWFHFCYLFRSAFFRMTQNRDRFYSPSCSRMWKNENFRRCSVRVRFRAEEWLFLYNAYWAKWSARSLHDHICAFFCPYLRTFWVTHKSSPSVSFTVLPHTSTCHAESNAQPFAAQKLP